MANPRKEYERIRYSGWPGGIHNIARDMNVPDGYLRAAQNVDVLPDGKIIRRRGYGVVAGAPGGHSAYSNPAINYGLYVSDAGELVRVDSLGNRITLANVSNNARMSYTFHRDTVYYGNGVQYGKVNSLGAHSLWGVDPPPPPVMSSSSNGGLKPGRYQACLAPVDNNGEEHALSSRATITLTSGDAILVSNIPSASGVASMNLYTTSLHAPDGQELFLCANIPSGTSTYTIRKTSITRPPRKEDQVKRVRPMSRLASFKRRILGASGSRKYLLFTEYQTSLYNAAYNWLPFEQTINGILPVEDGVFVGTTKEVYFCAGNDAADFTKVLVDGKGMCNVYQKPRIPRNTFPLEGVSQQGEIVMWLSTDGEIIVGRNGGSIQRVTTNTYALQRHLYTHFHEWEHDGRRTIISTLHYPLGGSNVRKSPDTT
jgi:hypothetical protein